MSSSSAHPFRSATAKANFMQYYKAREKEWPVPYEERIVETSYGPTYVRISGPANGQAMILLHGHSENSLNWLPNIAGLSQSYRTYTIDTITDPGRSICIQPMTTAKDYTTWLDEVFLALELEKICLIGLSFGGWLISQYALQFPHRVDKLILMAPAYTVFPMSKRFLLSGLLLMSGPMLLGLTRPEFIFKPLVKRYTQWIFNDLVAQGAKGKRTFEEWFELFYLGISSCKLRSLIWATVLSDEELNQLSMPTLFLVGENEIIYSPQKVIAKLESVAPNIQSVVIPNAGHDLPIAQPQLVNQAILEFVNT